MKTTAFKKSVVLSLAIVCLLGISSPFAVAQDKPKNVILFIGDGMGFGHIEITDYYEFGEAGHQVYEQDFKKLAMSTYPDGSEYDPQKAWSDFAYVNDGVTDSAAAATALATGVKTYRGAIGVSVDKKPLEDTVSVAEKSGKSTGVVTTVPLSHATPAGFVAHNESRNNYEAIAKEMFLSSSTDVIMGTGNPWYDKDGRARVTLNGEEFPSEVPEGDYKYVGGSDTLRQLLAGTAGGDADGDGKPDLWTLIQTREQFVALAKGDTPKRVAGIAQAGPTLQQGRTSAIGDSKKETPGQTPLVQTVPTLAEMAAGALNVLDNDPDGFFLMIEGGAVDWAAGDEPGRIIEEVMDLNRAVETVVKWVEANGGWDKNLVIVTADHETGYLAGPDSGPEWKPIVNNGKGAMPGVKICTGKHTRSLVPFFAKGKGADLFEAAATREDPRRGKFLDNTDVGKITHKLLEK